MPTPEKVSENYKAVECCAAGINDGSAIYFRRALNGSGGATSNFGD